MKCSSETRARDLSMSDMEAMYNAKEMRTGCYDDEGEETEDTCSEKLCSKYAGRIVMVCLNNDVRNGDGMNAVR